MLQQKGQTLNLAVAEERETPFVETSQMLCLHISSGCPARRKTIDAPRIVFQYCGYHDAKHWTCGVSIELLCFYIFSY
jgi:hypothetical protein